MEKNIYMRDQQWVSYDPAQWVLVCANRKLLFSNNPPEWVDVQDEIGMKQLEQTMERDKFIADRFESAMLIEAKMLVDNLLADSLYGVEA